MYVVIVNVTECTVTVILAHLIDYSSVLLESLVSVIGY